MWFNKKITMSGGIKSRSFQETNVCKFADMLLCHTSYSCAGVEKSTTLKNLFMKDGSTFTGCEMKGESY